jgi:cystathionine gamma-synthase
MDPATCRITERQMPKGCGPLLSFQIHGDARAADRVVAASRLIRPATSFGGVESTWERRARWASETAPETLIRLSIGLEATDDLIEDLRNSLTVLR